MEENSPGKPPPPADVTVKVFIIVAITMVAMAIPLAGVALMIKGHLLARQNSAREPSAAAAGVLNAQPLENALEKVATAQLGGEKMRIDPREGIALSVPVSEMGARIQRIEALARDAGGSALELSETGAETRRVVIQVPISRRELLQRAIRGEKMDFANVPAGGDTQMLTVILEKP